MSSCDRLFQASCTCCCNLAMVVACSGERESSCKFWMGVVLLKNTSSSCQRNGSSMGITTCTMWRHCLLYPAETSNLTASYNWWLPPHHEAWDRACVSWVNALQKMALTRSTPYTWMSITCIQIKSTLITEDNRVPFHSPVDSFMTPE